mmetsp:Transcript_67997/g.160054  ORF Transcript_67997/g.160054 Transcript_67997/m.160054 type:complete len:550 (+) Transcript_67997:72-1721(+)
MVRASWILSVGLLCHAALGVRPGFTIERHRRSRKLADLVWNLVGGEGPADLDVNTTTVEQPQEVCPQCHGAFTNYYTMLHASSRPHAVAAIILIAGIILTWLMVDTAQLFFLPALFYWSKRLRLSPEMAAATLLAIGNGAPDMADEVVAAQLQDLPLGLSDLGGANICCMSLGSCLCLLIAYSSDNDMKSSLLPHPRHYLVVLLLYSSAIVAVAFILRRATVDFHHVCALPALYCVFLIYLFVKGRAEAEEDAQRPRGRRRSSTHIAIDDAMACLSPPEERYKTVAWALMLPFTLLRLATIPSCDMRWDPLRRALHTGCPTGLYVLCRMLGYIPTPDFNTAVATGAVLGAVTVMLFVSGGVPSVKLPGSALPWFYHGMTVVALVASALWLSALSDEITSSLEGLCRFYNISRLRSGFILLAWGNSASDLVAAYSISMMGEFALAFNGLAASQFFNIAVGFSMAMIMITWDTPEIILFQNGWPADISHPLLVCAVSILIVVIILALFSTVELQVKAPVWGAVLAAVYGAFLVYMWMNTSEDVPHQLGSVS